MLGLLLLLLAGVGGAAGWRWWRAAQQHERERLKAPWRSALPFQSIPRRTPGAGVAGGGEEDWMYDVAQADAAGVRPAGTGGSSSEGGADAQELGDPAEALAAHVDALLRETGSAASAGSAGSAASAGDPDQASAQLDGEGVWVVTGGCGMVGRAVVAQLLARGVAAERVRVLDLPGAVAAAERDGLFGGAKVAYHGVALGKAAAGSAALAEAVRGARIVVHTAALIHYWTNHAHLLGPSMDVNVEGTRALLDAAAEAGVTLFVATSTSVTGADYANSPGGIWGGDVPMTPLDGPGLIEDAVNWAEAPPMNHYITTKRLAERMVREAHGRATPAGGVMRTCCLRPPGIMGPQDVAAARSIRPLLKLPAGKTGVIDMAGGYMNDELVDWLYVGDVASAHVLAAHRLAREEAAGVPIGEPIPAGTGAPPAKPDPATGRAPVGGRAFHLAAPKEEGLVSYRLVLSHFLAALPADQFDRISLVTAMPAEITPVIVSVADFLLSCGVSPERLGEMRFMSKSSFRTARLGLHLCSDAATRDLGWRPRYSIRDGARLSVQDMLKEL